MAKIIAVAGFAGSGKTTAINFCETQSIGHRVYIGRFVGEQVMARGLSPTPENESKVRMALREERGAACLADLAEPTIKTLLSDGRNVLIDAIASIDELNAYRRHNCSEFILLGIRASFAIRATKPLTEEELRCRDELETARLGTGLVMEVATVVVDNDSSLLAFHTALRDLLASG